MAWAYQRLGWTYLATLIVYPTILGADPRPLEYLPPGITPADGMFLRQVVWDTVREYRARKAAL